MKRLHNKVWYTPREAAKLKLIVAPQAPDSEEASYRYINRLINMGKIKSKVYGGREGYEYRILSDQAIAEYHGGEKAVKKWKK